MTTCITCDTTNVNLYDERFEVYACDEECLLEYIIHENAYAMLEPYMALNVLEITSEDE